jgi:glycerol-3-phosphate acyltransferase PlsY
MLAAASLPVSSLLSLIPSHAQDQPLQQTLRQIAHASPPFIGAAAIALLVVWKHRTNIRRIARGEEPRVGGKARRGDLHSGTAD